MVNAPGFDEDSYWTDDKLNDYMGCESCYGHEWAYAISEDLWEHIQNLESDWGKLSMAVAHIVMFGLGTGLPIMIIAWLISYSTLSISTLNTKLAIVEKWVRYVSAILFIGFGIYLCVHIGLHGIECSCHEQSVLSF